MLVHSTSKYRIYFDTVCAPNILDFFNKHNVHSATIWAQTSLKLEVWYTGHHIP